MRASTPRTNRELPPLHQYRNYFKRKDWQTLEKLGYFLNYKDYHCQREFISKAMQSEGPKSGPLKSEDNGERNLLRNVRLLPAIAPLH